MKAIIISDDVLSLKKVINNTATITDVELVKAFIDIDGVESFVIFNNIDVIFIDITSKKEEKISLVERIRNYGKTTFIVLISDSKEDSMLAYTLHAIGFLLKPIEPEVITEEIENIKKVAPYINKKIEVRTFGNFCILVNNKVIRFERKKSREILAFLIHKQGTQVDCPTLAAEILNKDQYDKKTQNTLHQNIESLRTTLKEYGVEDILCCTKGYLSVDTSRFECDLYDFLNGNKYAQNRYYGEYMYEYEWAANRIAYLDKIINFSE